MKNLGFHISLFSLAVILIWIGLFKFTPTEAKAIEPLVSTSPLMSWLYEWFGRQQISNLIGALEILTGILLIFYYVNPYSGLIGGALSIITFLITLSFLFSMPNAIQQIDGFWLPDTFILKDLMALGISVSIFMQSYQKILNKMQDRIAQTMVLHR